MWDWQTIAGGIAVIASAFGGGAIIQRYLSYRLKAPGVAQEVEEKKQVIAQAIKEKKQEMDRSNFDYLMQKQQEWIANREAEIAKSEARREADVTRLEAKLSEIWPQMITLREQSFDMSQRHLECEKKLLLIPSLQKRISDLEGEVFNAKAAQAPGVGGGRQPGC